MLETDTIGAVFFDCGGVLLEGLTQKGIYEILLGNKRKVNRDRLNEFLGDYRMLLGRKGDFERLLEKSYDDLGLRPADIIEIIESAPVIEGVWDIARDLKRNGVPVGVISDMPYEGVRSIRRRQDFETIFDPILFSSEVNTIKSNTLIYHMARERLEIKPKEAYKMLMVDDVPSNLEIAKRAGWNTLLYDGDTAELREALCIYELI